MSFIPSITIPSLSLRPGKLVLYKTRIKPAAPVETEPQPAAAAAAPVMVQLDAFADVTARNSVITAAALPAVAPAPAAAAAPRKAHNFELSPNAQKNLREKVSWLYHYAKAQTITTRNGKILSSFKMNFVTLKLPSVQQHTSDFITKNCLNQLFVEIAKKHSFKNYVWRLEYQKNGNLHYHIATDTYIDYYWLRSTWNRVLEKYGYVSAYKARFEAMSFAEYCRMTDFQDKADFDTKKRRYAEGRASGWKQPNSVDVKCVTNHKKIAFYISKYMGKGSSKEQRTTLPVCEDNSAHSRLWFCSRSLSRLKAIADFQECFSFDLVNFLDTELSPVRKVYDYCVCYYFDWVDLTNDAKKMFGQLFTAYGRATGYLSTS